MMYLFSRLTKIGLRWRLSNVFHFLKLEHNFATAVTDDFVKYTSNLIKSCSKIVVVAGAGLSTASGIPDFRSPGTGLYDNLSEYNLRHPTDIFDLSFFINNPKPFMKLAKYLYPGNYKPNEAHYFLKVLSDKKKLLRLYTQNIDSLEATAGVPEAEVVEAHGSFRRATCLKCKQQYDGNIVENDIMLGNIPYCRNDWCDGVIKPDIVFFGEDLPSRFFLHYNDLLHCDMMLILGTSLEVFPVASLVYQVPSVVPRVLINRDIVDPFCGDNQTRDVDAVYSGDIVEGVRKLAVELEWQDEISKLK